MKQVSVFVLLIGMIALIAPPLRANDAGVLGDVLPDKIFVNGFEQFTLTINNYLAWCAISENGNAFSPSMTFLQGSIVSLHAEPASAAFVWSYWLGTDGDTGGGDMNKVTTVTMSADRSVLACCPFASSPGMMCN